MLTCTSTFKMENCKICNVAGFFCQVVSSILSILTNQDLLRIDFFSNIIVWNSKLAVSLSFSMIYSPVVILTIMHITSMSVLKLERLLLLDFFLWDCFYLSKKNVNVLINQTSFFFLTTCLEDDKFNFKSFVDCCMKIFGMEEKMQGCTLSLRKSTIWLVHYNLYSQMLTYDWLTLVSRHTNFFNMKQSDWLLSSIMQNNLGGEVQELMAKYET